MAGLHPATTNEVIDVLSDSDNEMLPRENGFFEAQADGPGLLDDIPDVDHILEELNARYSPAYGAADGVIDLTNIPDVDASIAASKLTMEENEPDNPNVGSGSDQPVSEATCLQMVLDVLPGISINYALKFIQEQTSDLTRTIADCQRVVSQLIDGDSYPKEADEAKNKKRKRDNEDDWADFENAERDPAVLTYEADAIDLLKDEFLFVPVRHITNIVKEHKTLFKAFIVLEEQVRKYGNITNRFSKIGKARVERSTELHLIERGSQLPKELAAARKKVTGDMAKKQRAEEAEQVEQDNLKQAQDNNEMGECACCFNDVPLNRMISCNGEEIHLYCLECPKRHIETQMGQSRCKPKCFGVEDCNGTFTRHQLQQVLSEKTFERLEHMQQMEDLAAAGLDFLSECPFCDFKMECPPVEVDKEFRCQKINCGKTSCRLCQKETHIPLSCEEAKKNGQLTLRHVVEEAMSAALIRQCNRCKHPFVKELGCNKMTCTHCGNVQCYVCSKNVANYEHFGEAARGRCPLQDNVEKRHEEDVKKAADEAVAKVRAENPSLSDADLMIQVSDRVKKVEEDRKGRAQARAEAFPYQMVEDQLRPRPGIPGVPHVVAMPRLRPPLAHQPAPQYVLHVHNHDVAPVLPFDQPVQYHPFHPFAPLQPPLVPPGPLQPHQQQPPVPNMHQRPRPGQREANALRERPDEPGLVQEHNQRRLQMIMGHRRLLEENQRRRQIWREHEQWVAENLDYVQRAARQNNVPPRR